MADRTINWDGRDYRVPERDLFELLEGIEQHITLPELMVMVGGGKPNFSALARPLHSMLNHVGVRNAPSMLELRRMLVAEGMQSLHSSAKGETPVTGAAMQVVAVMIELLMDGAPDMGEPTDTKKKAKPRSRKAATKSRSGNGA